MSPKGEKDQDPGFASRWSRLKQDARNPVAAQENHPETSLPTEAETVEGNSDEEILESLGLPNPDSLKPGDDFAAFMSKAVPARLRSRALRKLWITNPVLANLDELVDYGEDFTDAATVVETLATGYQVGKGWAEKVVQAPKSLTADEEVAPDESADDDTTESAELESTPELETEPAAAAPDPLPDQTGSYTEKSPEAPVAAQQFPVRRRMRFRVAED